MRQELKASIIVRVHKTEDYLPRCIESLLNQTHKDFEIIVVDDHSPGDVPALLRGFPSEHPTIEYVRHDRNRGILCSGLTGIDRSSGDYIGFVDSDDYARPVYVERMLAVAADTGADIIGSGKDAANGRPSFDIQGPAAVLEAYATGQIANWAVWTKFYARDLVTGLAELRAFAQQNSLFKAADLVFNIFCALQGPRYVNIDEVLIAYNRERIGSATNVDSSARRRQSFQSIIAVYEAIRDAGAEYDRAQRQEQL